jgi:hypothetical protein
MAKIQAEMILEILGRPAEHIKVALTALVEKLGSEKGVKVISKTIHEPSPIKDSKDLHTTFAEVSVEFDTFANYFGVIFSYMPAHLEIISPTNVELSNLEMNDLGNKLISRLHEYDAIAKTIINEREFLVEKLKEHAPHLFRQPDQAAPVVTQAQKTKTLEEKTETKVEDTKKSSKKKKSSK